MAERNGINEINKVCKAALKLKDEDFAEAFEMAKGQLEYIHPLKNATARWQSKLGYHNTQVLNALQNLRNVIRQGENIESP